MNFCLFFATCCYAFANTNTIKQKVDRLHKFTKFSTFYEFFKIPENATDFEIMKAHKKITKKSLPSGVSKETYNTLIADGWAVLNSLRDEYDDMLRNPVFYSIDNNQNYKNDLYIILCQIIAFIVLADLIFYAIRYFRYIEESNVYKACTETEKRQWVSVPKLPGSLFLNIYKKLVK